MSLSKIAVKKPVTTLIIFILLTALGIYCTFSLPLDMYPDMDIPYILVITNYENAGPEEVEKSVTRIMESSLSSVTGLKKMTSTSQMGTSLVIMEFEYGTNLDESTSDIRDKIDLVRNYLPDDADSPIIFRMDPSMMPIMALVVTGERTPEELSSYVEDLIEPRLEQIDGVASVSIAGDREKAVLIDIPRDRLDAYELTVTQIAQMIGAQNITSSGGTIESGDSNYTISAEGTYNSIEDIKGTVVTYKTRTTGVAQPEMVSVMLRDLADVYEGYKDSTSMAYLDGTPSVMLRVQKQSGKNSVSTAEKVRKQLDSILRELPSDIKIVETYNTTDDIQNTINQVVESLLEGIVLAVIVLYIFLRSFKSTFIIALAIPVSVIITLCLMYFCGFSINMMTLSGLLLGIGMLVDNSIVILENIFSYRERDAKPEVAAVLGAEEMIGAISSSTLTTVCIFLPMIMFRKMLGMMGKMFESFAFTIVFSLMCSLLVAAVLVPVLSSKYLRIEKVSERKLPGPLDMFDRMMGKFFSWLDDRYASGVKIVLAHRKTTLFIVFGLLVVSVLIIPVIGFTFMPNVPATSVTVELEMPKGTTLEATREVIQQMESNILADLRGVKFSTLSVGGTGVMSSDSDSNTASLTISLYS
ncbi:MAG: efflux RND transporter permease subunit, partial [Treponemataceae bacterium]|nr:efflux RND transporter permease subunit [Treponemataceae bacterium]